MKRGSRRSFLAALAGGCFTASQSETLAVYRDRDLTTGTVEAGTLDLKLASADQQRLPTAGDLVLAPGETTQQRLPLTNSGNMSGHLLQLSLATQTSDEGQTDPSETNTDPADGGELDNELEIRVFIEQNDTVVGYFFGNATSFVPYLTAVSQGNQTLTPPTPLSGTDSAVLVVEFRYPSGSSAALGDRLVFDMNLGLNSKTTAEGWLDVDRMTVAIQAGTGQVANVQTTQLSGQEYDTLSMNEDSGGQGRIGKPGVGPVGSASREHWLGPTATNPAVRENRDWVKNRPSIINLTYDPRDNILGYGVIPASDQNQLKKATLSYSPAVTSLTDLLIYGVGAPTGTLTIDQLELNGQPINESLTISNARRALRLSNIQLEEGFTFTAQVVMSWSGNQRPSADSQFYRLRVGRVTNSP